MKTIQFTFLALCLACGASAQLQQKAREPVPILKQISKQNDDGSYSFGYEAGDGSYKIETKYPDGEVQGKYGYVDDSGKLREVEYGASSKGGFRPQGNDINVPPPTLSNEVRPGPLADGEEDDGQYREDPSIYDTKEYKNSLPAQRAPARRPAFKSIQQPAQSYQPVQQTQTYQQAPENYYQQPAQPARQTFKFQNSPFQGFNNYQQPEQSSDYEEPAQQTFSGFQRPLYQSYQQPARNTFQSYQQPQQTQQVQQPQQRPQFSSYSQTPYSSNYVSTYNGHPSVKNFDIGTGSYSINYSGR